jgi:alanine dehydrogenase
MKAVAWNGLEVAFDVLEQRWPGLRRPDGQPVRVLILGTGMVGKHAIEAATKLGNIERNNQHIQDEGPGAIAVTIGRNLTHHPAFMEELFRQADILVDATQRRDPSQPVIPNHWLAWLPEHAIITDLAVDPYTLDATPPVVRGIEGIPQGNLDKYVFKPDDPDWAETVPASVPTSHRRTVVSCYSWPGIHPEACMRHYAQQLEPLLEPLVEKGYDNLSPAGGFFERAMYRATLRAWLKLGHYEARPR